MEFAIAWALQLPVFGVTPIKPVKSLIIQAENDQMDLAEMAQGVLLGQGIIHGSEKYEEVLRHVLFKPETKCVGDAFLQRLYRLLDRERPDIVWIDPLLSFAGIDVSKQDQCTRFLREGINPVLEATGAILIGVHHTGKPKDQKITQNWSSIDFAYSGLGSSELVNWARAIMTIQPLDAINYALHFAKRGSRAGAEHPDQEPTQTVYIRHGRQGIKWDHVDKPAEPEPAERKAPKQATKGEQLAGLPWGALVDTITEPWSRNHLAGQIEVFAATHKIDIGVSTARNHITKLVSNGTIKKTEKGYIKS